MSNDQQLVCPICSSGAPQVLKERRWEYKIYQCTECGVEYASPLKSVPIDDPRIKKCYQRRLELAGDYLGWAHREFSKTKILKRDSKILEIGCGTGDFINFLNAQNIFAVGVDLDPEAISIGRKFWRLNNIYFMSAADYFEKNHGDRFDIICLFAVLEHLEDPSSVIEEIKKYLDPNGYIVVEIPNTGSPLNKIYRKLTKYVDYPPDHLTRWTQNSLKRFLINHGFRIVYVKTSPPSISDIVSDMLKIFSPSIVPIKIVKYAMSLSHILLLPFDWFISKFVKEGRDMLIMGQLS